MSGSYQVAFQEWGEIAFPKFPHTSSVYREFSTCAGLQETKTTIKIKGHPPNIWVERCQENGREDLRTSVKNFWNNNSKTICQLSQSLHPWQRSYLNIAICWLSSLRKEMIQSLSKGLSLSHLLLSLLSVLQYSKSYLNQEIIFKRTMDLLNQGFWNVSVHADQILLTWRFWVSRSRVGWDSGTLSCSRFCCYWSVNHIRVVRSIQHLNSTQGNTL